MGEPVGGPTFPTTTSHVPGTPAWPGQTPAWFGNEVELEDDYQERIETDQPMTTQDWLNEALLPADVLVDKYGIDNLDIMRALEKQGLISYEDWEDWRDMYEAIYG